MQIKATTPGTGQEYLHEARVVSHKNGLEVFAYKHLSLMPNII
jgi:hypothetical protein